MNLKSLSDNELHESNIKTAERERAIGIEMIEHLVETNRRRLYSIYDCSSLHDYCVKKLKMTNGDAYRKLGAARLLNEQPNLQAKLQDGSLSPTHLADASAFFKKENTPLTEKAELLKQIENTSTEKARSILLSKSKAPDKHLRDRAKPKTAKLTEVTIYLDEDAMESLKRLKEIWSHAVPQGEFSKIIKRAAKEAVEKHDPMKKAERAQDRARKSGTETKEDSASYKSTQTIAESNAATTIQDSAEMTEVAEVARQTDFSSHALQTGKTENSPPTGFSKAWIEHAVRLRDQDSCTHVDPITGERCRSKHFLEFDHITPKAMGGPYTIENLRLRCRAHNQRHAIETYGTSKMRSYLRGRVQPYGSTRNFLG